MIEFNLIISLIGLLSVFVTFCILMVIFAALLMAINTVLNLADNPMSYNVLKSKIQINDETICSFIYGCTWAAVLTFCIIWYWVVGFPMITAWVTMWIN